MTMSPESLYAEELAHLARAWVDAEIDITEYRAQRTRLVDAFEETMNESTRPFPPSQCTRPLAPDSKYRWLRFWPALMLTLVTVAVATAVLFVL